MTKYQSLIKQLEAALQRLEEVLQQEKSTLIRDAAIKRFEFTFDLAWKVLKALLKEKKGIDCASPKDCFRAAYQQGVIEYNEIWLKMTDWRNEIVHIYNESEADRLYKNLPEISGAFQTLARQLQTPPDEVSI